MSGSDNNMQIANSHRIVHHYGKYFIRIITRQLGKKHFFFIFGNNGKSDAPFRSSIDKPDCNGGTCEKFIPSESVLYLITDVRMYPAYYLTHQFFGSELQQFVSNVHLINKIIITVQSARRIRLAARIFDDDRSLPKIHQR